VEHEADEAKAAAFLPEGLKLESYMDPVCGQYRKTIFLLSMQHEKKFIAYCSFIWVSRDKSMMRGLIQG
jgi:hypothetical protein